MLSQGLISADFSDFTAGSDRDLFLAWTFQPLARKKNPHRFSRARVLIFADNFVLLISTNILLFIFFCNICRNIYASRSSIILSRGSYAASKP